MWYNTNNMRSIDRQSVLYIFITCTSTSQTLISKRQENFYDLHKPRIKRLLPRPQRMQSKRKVLHGLQLVSVFPRCSPFWDILRAFFIAHPEQCPVSFEPVPGEITDGIPTFTFSNVDEHYQIKIVGDTNVLGYSISQHGRQPALWTHQYGKGRVIGITPGHSYENLGQPEYLKLLIRCAEYCAK